MSEWWTYRPSDFLMFAPDTYWRLFELHNTALWPLPLLASAMLVGWAMALAWAPRHHKALLLRTGLFGLAACTAFVGWAFLWHRYAHINWAANGFALGFAGLAAGLLLLSLMPSPSLSKQPMRRHVGIALLVWAAMVHPLLPLAWAGSLTATQWPAAAPDPTALAVLGALLLAQSDTRTGRCLWGLLLAITVAWCAVSAATLWTMGSAQGWLVAGPALLGLWALVRRA